MEATNRETMLNHWLQLQRQRKRLDLGICFERLDCYGSSSAAETTQPDALTYVTALPHRLSKYLFRKSQPRPQILHDFSGLVRPGEMLLVLGRPGSGCSSLLKVLSGQLHGISVGARTNIEYSGVPYDDIRTTLKGEAIYLAELDAHFAELTLGETLNFAALTRPHDSSSAESPDILSRNIAGLFSLRNAFDTKMGNAMIRGVSGGETRRTSIAEAFISGASVQCWDNSTRGLDSATARQFIDLLRASTDSMRTSIVMSIYQSSDAMYQNFDNVTLLYSGRQIYFGRTQDAVNYFARLGFAKQERASIADFLTSITNPAERVILEGFESRIPRTPDEFAAAWKDSPEAAELATDIEAFRRSQPLGLSWNRGSTNANSLSTKELLQFRSSTYPLSIYRQISICVRRGVLRIRNNYAPPVSTVFANAILAIVVGTVYYDLPDTAESMQRRSILVFFSLMICAFSPAFEVLTMWAQRPIVEKHDRYAFYHPLSEGVSSMICDLPAKFATSILFHITVYFMANLRRTASAFFTYLTFMFFIVLTMSMVFRSLGSLSRTMEQTMAPASTIVLLCIIYTGFVIPVPYMKPWLSWFRRINPMAYAYESLMINEFHNREFPCLQLIPNGPEYDGQQNTSNGKTCPIVGASPGQASVQGSSYLQLTYGFVHSHLWRNFGIIMVMMVIFCVIHLYAAEFVPAQRSKGEIPVFRTSKRLCLATDLENDRRTVLLEQEIQGLQGDIEGDNEGLDPTAIYEEEPIFNWHHLNYEVKRGQGSRKILTDINGWVQPGTVTALMGVTGAGKTTLLDVLANRVTYGTPTGEVRVGNRLRDKGFQRKIGYVQQNDIHLATATVREALEFSASLRQPKAVPQEEKMKHVQYVIKMLEMECFADAVVGIPGYGLNIEQRKRLSIGVELAAKPEVLLFLDEPTSGLDSQTAWSICKLLRKLSKHGHAILCTIHQPSSQIFAMFDRLLLLNDCGQTIYFGDIGQDSSTLLNYFENNGANQCKPGQNPAEWVLDLSTDDSASSVGSGVRDRLSSGESQRAHSGRTWADRWDESEQRAAVEDYLRNLSQQRHAGEKSSSVLANKCEATQTKEYAVSQARQLWLVSKRAFEQVWRDPTYLYSKLLLCVGVSFFNGVSFYDNPLDLQGFTNFLFSIFLITQLFSTIDQQIIPRLIDSRRLFEACERRSKSYSWTIFLTSNILVELWWQTVASVIVYVSWYYLTLLWQNGTAEFTQTDRGGLTFMLIWLLCLWITTFSQLVGIGLPHAETAVQLATLCFWLSLVFCGVLVPYNDLPRFWKFVYRASPLTYFINGMVLAGLSGTQLSCSDVQLLNINLSSGSKPGITCGDYLTSFASSSGGRVQNPEATSNCLYCPVSQTDTLLQQLGMPTDHAWWNAGLMTVYIVFNMICTYAIYWLTRVYKKEIR